MVNLGDNLNFVRSVTVTVNCPGSVFVMEDSDCSELNDATVSNISSLDWNKQPPVHFLVEHSNLSVWYSGTGNNFVVVRSLVGYNQYLQLCWELMDRNCSKSDQKLVKMLCSDRDSVSVPLPNDFSCFQVNEATWFSFLVKKNDFYYFSIPVPYPFKESLKTISYNTSQFPELGFKEFPLQTNSAGKYSVNFPITNNVFEQPKNCVVLGTICASDTKVYDVSYEFEHTKTPYYCVGVGLAVLAAMLFLVQVGCFCYRRKKADAKEKDEGEDETI